MVSVGQCAEGYRLTEAECQSASEFGSGWGGAGSWGLPETCGCYIDQDGMRYFNALTGACNQPEEGEQMICHTHGKLSFD